VSTVKKSRVGRAGKRASTAASQPARRLRAPVGRTQRLLKVERGVARLRLRPDRSFGAKMLYLFGFVFAVGMVLVALFHDDDGWWLVPLALLFLVPGYLYGLADRETRLDFERKRVFQGKGTSVAGGIPFTNLAGILALARTELVRTDQGSHEVRRFVLGLLVADDAAPVNEMVQAIRRDRVALIRDGHQPAPHELAPRLERELFTQVITVVDYPDETAVWQAAEWLAKKLDLPLVDACSSPTLLRVPEELDLPLGERLALGLQEVDSAAAYASGPAPDGAGFKRERDGFTLTWREDRSFDIGMMLGLELLLVAIGVWLGRDDSAGFWISTGFAVCLLPLVLLVTQWHGTNQIVVDRKRVQVTRGPFGKRLVPLATASVEAVRLGGTSAYPLLSLVSDRRVLKVRMAPPLARWAKQHIERQLRALHREPPKAPE